MPFRPVRRCKREIRPKKVYLERVLAGYQTFEKRAEKRGMWISDKCSLRFTM